MNTRLELGRIAGVPIYLDMLFLLVLIIFAHPYFTGGNVQQMSVGLIVIAGVIVSMLLHELGHAMAARFFRVGTREIELTGFGGVARFSQSLPRSVLARTVIYLAGPAANLALWLGLQQLAQLSVSTGKIAVFQALFTLSFINMWLLIFNLLPAYPLDGGQTLDAWLGPILGPAWSVRVVAALGLVVVAGCVLMAFPTNVWMLFLAMALFQANWSALQSVGGFGGGGRRR
jgi:Zn-dependent protease